VLKKKIWSNFHNFLELFTQKIVTKLSKVWVWDPGSGIRDPGSGIRKKSIPDPGARIQGSKRHRIPDPGSGSATLVFRENQISIRICICADGLNYFLHLNCYFTGRRIRISDSGDTSKRIGNLNSGFEKADSQSSACDIKK
jgi:hypothetical protein